MLMDINGYQKEIRLKIIVVGEVSTGKTSYIERFVNNKFMTAYKPTIGVDFGLKTIQWDPTTKIKIQLWDCCGSTKYYKETRIYYQNAVGALLFYDLSCQKSFHEVTKWKKQIDDKVVLNDGRRIKCVLIGNKCDTASEISELPSLDEFCKENNFDGHFLTSAKDNTNITESLNFLIQQILSDKKLAEHLFSKKTISNEIIIKKSGFRKVCC